MPTLEAALLQREREIDRRRRLADAALARGDGDDVGDARHPAWPVARIAGGTRLGEGRALRGCRLALSVAAAARDAGRTVCRQRHDHAVDTGKRFHHALGGLAQSFELARAARIDGDGEIDLALVDDDLGDEALRDDVGAEVRAFDPLQRFEHALFAGSFGHDEAM